MTKFTHFHLWHTLLLTSLSLLILPAGAAENLPKGVDSVTGFRMQRYRAPVPDFLPGGTVVDTDAVAEFKQAGNAVLLNVYPPKGLGPDPLNGDWIITERHNHIEDSTWLPDVGRGHIEPDERAYFERHLKRITNGDKNTAIVFYCTADCWQSWNAARRAILWGYTDVYWYPEGIDGWLDEGYGLVPAQAVNFLE